MSERKILPEDQMMQWITTKWIAKPIAVVSELGIADLMADGSKSVAELAEETGTHAPSLFRVLRSLSSVGVFAETDDQTFALTPLAECLLSDALRPIARMFLSEWHDRAWNGLMHSVRTGTPGFDRAFGISSFDWFEENPEARAVLDQGQGAKAAGFAKAVLDAHDFSALKSVCDIGGGQGIFLVHLLKAYPGLLGCVADLPGAVASARKTIEQAGLNGRCRAVSYDFNRAVPPVCDAYFLVNVLHDWDDPVCIRILKNVAGAMAADTRLWIVEYLLESAPGFSVAKLLDLEMLVMSGGRERSVAEYQELVGAAGLVLSGVTPLKGGLAMMECSKGQGS